MDTHMAHLISFAINKVVALYHSRHHLIKAEMYNTFIEKISNC